MTIINTLNKNETYSSYYNSNITGNKIIDITNSAYKLNVLSSKNVDLITNTGGSTILDNDIEHNNLLYTEGGTLIKKDVWIGGNLNINGNLNALGGDLTQLIVDDVVIDNPLLLTGYSYTDATYDTPINGLINRYGPNNKFTGLIKNNIGTKDYGLIYNINPNNNNNTDVDEAIVQTKITSKTDQTSFANISIDKLNVLNDGEIDDLKTLGSINISKNIFIGDETLSHQSKITGTNNSIYKNPNSAFTFESQQTLKIITTNSKDINIESKKNSSTSISGVNTINIDGNLTENVTGTHNKTITSNSDEIYKISNSDTTTGNIFNTIDGSIQENIHNIYNINITGDLKETVKQNRIYTIDNNLIETYTNNYKALLNYNEILSNINSTVELNNTQFTNDNNKKINGINNLTILNNNSEHFNDNLNRHILNVNNLNYKSNSNLNINNKFNLLTQEKTTELYKQTLKQHTDNYTITVQSNSNIINRIDKNTIIGADNISVIYNKNLNIYKNSNITIKGNNIKSIYDNSIIKLDKNNIINITNNVAENINNNNYKFINGIDTKILKSNNFMKITNNKSTTYHNNFNRIIQNNLKYDLETDKVLTSSLMNIKTPVSNWRNLNLTTNVSNIVTQSRYIIAVKYVKNSITYKTTLASNNIDNIDNLKTELNTLLNTDSINTIDVNASWQSVLKDSKIQVFTTLDNNNFNLGQYGSNSTMPLLNLDNNPNIDLTSGFNIIRSGNSNIFEINNFNLVSLDSHTPPSETNIQIYGNGLNSSNINIVYFSDTGQLVFSDTTPNIYTEHITNDNINNYDRLNAVGTNYNIQTFDKNIKTDITISKDDYVKGNSYIFDIDKTGIIDGNINVNNLNKPGLYNEYHFNKSITTPFDYTFSTSESAQYNINNWIFPLNSDNNNNEGRIFNKEDYFAFNLKYDKQQDIVTDIQNCPKVFDIYGITADKNFTIFDIDTSKSLLTPNIKSSNLINETPTNLKLTQGITDINKSINNIDISNYYLSKNNYKDTTLDLSNITLNIDNSYVLTLNSLNIIDSTSYVGVGNPPKVVEDPIHYDNKVILIDGQGMKFKTNGSTFDGLNRDKFSFEANFNLIYNSDTYKHYIYSQCNTTNFGFNIYILNGDIYIQTCQNYDNYVKHVINLTNFVDTDKINYNEWYHFAFTKNISQISVFLNGKKYSVNSLDDYNDLSLYSSDLYHPGVIGASNFEGDSIVSLNGYISDFKLYNGYVIYESDFIPTKRNCLLKLDIHKYNNSNNYYTNYNKNILVNSKLSIRYLDYNDGTEIKNDSGVFILPDLTNNNNDLTLHSAPNPDGLDAHYVPVPPVYNTVENAMKLERYGYFKTLGQSNIKTIFMVFQLPNITTNTFGDINRTLLTLEDPSNQTVKYTLRYERGGAAGHLAIEGDLRYQKMNGVQIRTYSNTNNDLLDEYTTDWNTNGSSDYMWSYIPYAPTFTNAESKIVLAIKANETKPVNATNDSWYNNNSSNYLSIFNNVGPEETLLYEVICYNEILTDGAMEHVSDYLNKKWSVYETSAGNYSPNASDTLPETNNIIFNFDGSQLKQELVRNSININGLEDKTINLIKDTLYNFICNSSDNNNSILSIVNDYSKKFTANSADRLGTYDLEITNGTEINNWNNSSTRKLVWTPTTSGTYYYYSWDGSNNSTKNYGGIIIVYDDEPVLDNIICSNNNKTTITNEALSNGNKVVVSSTQSKQHDYSLYFDNSKLSMTLPNNMKGFNSDINSIQFYAYIINNSYTNSVLFSQGDDVSLEIVLPDAYAARVDVPAFVPLDNTISLPDDTNNNNNFTIQQHMTGINQTGGNGQSGQYYLPSYDSSIKAIKLSRYGVWLSAGSHLDAYEYSQTTLTEAPADETAYLTYTGAGYTSENNLVPVNTGWNPTFRSQSKVPDMPNPINARTIFMVFNIDEFRAQDITSVLSLNPVWTETNYNDPVQQPEGHYVHYNFRITQHKELQVFGPDLQYQTVNGKHFISNNTAYGWAGDWRNAVETHTGQRATHLNSFVSGYTDKIILALRANDDNDPLNNFWGQDVDRGDKNFNSWKVSNPSQMVYAFGEVEYLSSQRGINIATGPAKANLYEILVYEEQLSLTEIDNTIKYLNKKWTVYETDTDDITRSVGSGNYSSTGPTTLPRTLNRVSHFNGKIPNNQPSSSQLKLTHNSNEIILNTPNIQYNKWTHFIYQRYYNIIYLYINGIRYSSVSPTDLSVSNTNTLYLGYGDTINSYLKGYMDNIEVYDNTLLYDDIVNVKYLDNILYMNNKLSNTNLFNNKHLLFNFGNTNTQTLFEGNSNIGLTPISSKLYISYNLPSQNSTILRYDNTNDGYITNPLYIQNNTSGTYTNNYLNDPIINYDNTNTPIISIYNNHKLSIELNTIVNPTTSITIRGNNNIVKSENIVTSLDYIADLNLSNNIYKLNYEEITPSGILTTIINNELVLSWGDLINNHHGDIITENGIINGNARYISSPKPGILFNSTTTGEKLVIPKSSLGSMGAGRTTMYVITLPNVWSNTTTTTFNLIELLNVGETSINTYIKINNAQAGMTSSKHGYYENNSTAIMDLNDITEWLDNTDSLNFNTSYLIEIDGEYSNESKNATIYLGDSKMGVIYNEILVYNEHITTSNKNLIRNYLKNKWISNSSNNENIPYITDLTYHLDGNKSVTIIPWQFKYNINNELIRGNIDNNIFTYNNHGLSDHLPIYFNTNITGVSANKLYMADYIDANTFKIKENVSDATNIVINNPTTNQAYDTTINYNHDDPIPANGFNIKVIKSGHADAVAKKELISDNTNLKFSATHKPFLYDSLPNKPTVIKLNRAYLELTADSSSNPVMSAVKEIYIVHRMTWPIHRFADDYNNNNTTYSLLDQKNKFHYDFNDDLKYKLGTNLITIKESNKILLQIGTISKSITSNGKYSAHTYAIQRISNSPMHVYNYVEGSTGTSSGPPGQSVHADLFTQMQSSSAQYEPYKWTSPTGLIYSNTDMIKDSGILNTANTGWFGRLGDEDDDTWKDNLVDNSYGSYYEGSGPSGFVRGKLESTTDNTENMLPGTANNLPGQPNSIINNSLGYNITRIKFDEAINMTNMTIQLGGVYQSPESHHTHGAGESLLLGDENSPTVFTYHTNAPSAQNSFWEAAINTTTTTNDPDTNPNNNVHDSNPDRNIPFERWTYKVTQNEVTHHDPESNSSNSSNFKKINDFELGNIMFYGGGAGAGDEFTNVHKNLANQFGFKQQTSLNAPTDFKWSSSEINSTYTTSAYYKEYNELVAASSIINIPIDLDFTALFKLSYIENLFTINNTLQNIITPFKKYIVTEINNQYYLDGIANKFIELNIDDTIIFDLSSTTINDKSNFEIVNNEFDRIAINTGGDSNYIFKYNGIEKTLFYVKSNFKSKNTINFGEGDTPHIDANTIYHCFTGFIYNLPDNVTIIYNSNSENIFNNEFEPRLPGKYQITHTTNTTISAELYVSFGNEIRVKNNKLNVDNNDIYIINNYNRSNILAKNFDYNMNSSNSKLFGGINLWGKNCTEDLINQIGIKSDITNWTINNYDYLNCIAIYHKQSSKNYITNNDSIKNIFLTTKKSNQFTFNTDFNIIASVGNYNLDTPYKFTKDMTYNFRAEFDNFPKSWKIYGSTSKTPDVSTNGQGLTNDILLAEHTCVNKQLDNDGFIMDGPFYYNKLTSTNTDIYWIHIQITDVWDTTSDFNLSGFYTQIKTNKEQFKGSIKKIYSSSTVTDMSNDAIHPYNSNISSNTQEITKDNLYKNHYLVSKYNQTFDTELFYWYYMIIYAHNSKESNSQLYNLGVKFDEFIPKLDNFYFDNILTSKNNITGPNYSINPITINDSSISLTTSNYDDGYGYLLNYDSVNGLTSQNQQNYSNTSGFNTPFSLQTYLSEGYNTSQTGIIGNRSIWIIPLNDAENTKNGRILMPDNKFAFKINDINKAPIRYDIYGVTKKDITIDNLNKTTTSRLSNTDLSDSDIITLHINNYYNDTNKFNILSGNHILETYNQTWNRSKFYWFIFVFYGINTIDSNVGSNYLCFDEFKTQLNSYSDSDNNIIDVNLTTEQLPNINKFEIEYIGDTFQNSVSIDLNHTKKNHSSFDYNITKNNYNYINNNSDDTFKKSLTSYNQNNLLYDVNNSLSSINYNINQNYNKKYKIDISNNLETEISQNMKTLVGGSVSKNININLYNNITNDYNETVNNNVHNVYKSNYTTKTINLSYNINNNNTNKIKGDYNKLHNNNNNITIYGTTNETYKNTFNSTISNNLSTISTNNIINNYNENLNVNINKNMATNIIGNDIKTVTKNVSEHINNNNILFINDNSFETFKNDTHKTVSNNKNKIIHGNKELRVTSSSTDNYDNKLNIKFKENNNNTIECDYNLNVIGLSTTNILGDSNITSSSQNIHTYAQTVNSEFKNTLYNKITGNQTSILLSNSNITISNNFNETIKTKNISVFDNTIKQYNKNLNITLTDNLVETVYGTSNIIYSNDTTLSKATSKTYTILLSHTDIINIDREHFQLMAFEQTLTQNTGPVHTDVKLYYKSSPKRMLAFSDNWTNYSTEAQSLLFPRVTMTGLDPVKFTLSDSNSPSIKTVAFCFNIPVEWPDYQRWWNIDIMKLLGGVGTIHPIEKCYTLSRGSTNTNTIPAVREFLSNSFESYMYKGTDTNPSVDNIKSTTGNNPMGSDFVLIVRVKNSSTDNYKVLQLGDYISTNIGIYEVIVYEEKIDDAQRDNIRDYLQTKWCDSTPDYTQTIPYTTNKIYHLDSSVVNIGPSPSEKASNNIIISKNLNINVNEFNNLTVTNNINIKTHGGLNITSHLNRSLDFMGNTGINHIKSIIPNIITTQLLLNANAITQTSDVSNGEYLIDPLKTLNIISIDNTNNITNTYNTSDMFIRLQLLPGKYNGQICKIVLHPQFETLFDINTRNYNNLLQEVIIRIESFVDTGTNESISAELTLNRGGMSINLIYVATTANSNNLLTNNTKPYSELTNDPNNDSDPNNDVDDRGYWMIIDNNFNTMD